MLTVEEYIKQLEALPKDEVILVPMIWTKAIAEEELLNATELEVVLTNEQWEKAVEIYEANYYADYEFMVEAVQQVIGAKYNSETYEWKIGE
jgi:hypothetical protein